MTGDDAPGASGSSDPLESLLEECIARAEQDGDAGVDDVCARNPAHADTLRRELAMLRELGLLDPASPASPAAEPDGPPVERIGDFRLLRTLGRGGMGVVYLAEQLSLGRLVALKVLRGWAGAGVARFQREAQTIARLRHPSIVTLYGAGEDGDARWLAMELVPGRGLDEILADARGPRGAAPEIQSVVRWGAELARALACAHEAGVVHRDVKPSNVRITKNGPDGRAMLLDFGLARDFSQPALSRTGEFQGSPHYASPEQVGGGRSPLDARTDVWSLGATLYECVTGDVPHAGETTEQIFNAILTREPEPPKKKNPAVSRDLETVILKALEKDPATRYPSAGALATDLEAILALRPIAARRPGRFVRGLKWARRNRAAAAGVAVALLAVLVAGGVLLMQSREARSRARAELRQNLEDARRRLDAFKESRARLAEVEASVAVLRDDLEYRHFSPEEDRLLDRNERTLEHARREREELGFAVDTLLDRADEADPGNSDARALRVELYLEKMMEAESARDARLADFYREQVVALEPGGERARDLSTGGEVAFDSEPPGARVQLFRYREQSELDPDGEPRLVPVPLDAGGREMETPVAPGTLVLRVVRGAGEVAAGDLIVELNGFPIAGAMLAAASVPPVAAFDRLASIGGRPVSGPYDLELLERRTPQDADAARDYAFDRGAERVTVSGASLAALGISVVAPAVLAERGGLPATLVRGGRRETLPLPPGLAVRATAAPIVAMKGALTLTTPSAPVRLEPGGYLALVSLEGFESVRYSLRVDRTVSSRARVRLDKDGTTPDGFVRVTNSEPGLADEVPDFWMQEREVTFGEYLEFLNDPATLRALESGTADLVPRDGEGAHCARGADGRFALARDTRDDWPVFGVSWFAAQAFAKWRTDRARAAGVPFDFALPTFGEWKLAGHGADRRIYAYGMRFRPRFAKSNYSRPTPDVEPVMRYPVDETIFGAFDTSGSVMEWLDAWYRDGEAYRRAAGGSWGQSDPDNAFLVQGGIGARPEQAWNIVGFRLVARPRR